MVRHEIICVRVRGLGCRCCGGVARAGRASPLDTESRQWVHTIFKSRLFALFRAPKIVLFVYLLGSSNPSRISVAIRWKTDCQSPKSVWRNSRVFGYQGLRSLTALKQHARTTLFQEPCKTNELNRIAESLLCVDQDGFALERSSIPHRFSEKARGNFW